MIISRNPSRPIRVVDNIEAELEALMARPVIINGKVLHKDLRESPHIDAREGGSKLQRPCREWQILNGEGNGFEIQCTRQ